MLYTYFTDRTERKDRREKKHAHPHLRVHGMKERGRREGNNLFLPGLWGGERGSVGDSLSLHRPTIDEGNPELPEIKGNYLLKEGDRDQLCELMKTNGRELLYYYHKKKKRAIFLISSGEGGK